MEYFDVVDEAGLPTGETVSRENAHTYGILHRTAHVWIVRQLDTRTQVLLQKRSMEKDSFPGLYDTSSAGHIPAGDVIRYEKEFHGRMFRDNEVTRVYVYQEPVDAESLTLQKSEVDEVRWFDLDEVHEETLRGDSSRFCVPLPGLEVLIQYLDKCK